MVPLNKEKMPHLFFGNVNERNIEIMMCRHECYIGIVQNLFSLLMVLEHILEFYQNHTGIIVKIPSLWTNPRM